MMDFNYWDLGQQPEGAVVRVSLEGNAANVKLMEYSDYRSYQSGQRHNYYGGHYTSSPVVLTVPRAGHWFVTIDYGGLSGRGKAAVQVVSG